MPREGLIRSILSSLGIEALGPSLAKRWPELEKQWISQQMELPEETGSVPRIMEAGPIFKFLNPEAYAVTGPLGTISLNRELIERDKQDLGDVLAHELGHVKQGGKGYLKQYYDRDALEREAINTEAFRKRRKKDIELRKK